MAREQELRSSGLAEIGYSREYNRIELVVPHGTRAVDFARISEKLFTDVLSRLPRGCPNCFSGEDFNIRERLEHVLFVDFESMEVVREG